MWAKNLPLVGSKERDLCFDLSFDLSYHSLEAFLDMCKIAALFSIITICEQAKCPSINDWSTVMTNIYIIEYCSGMKIRKAYHDMER